MLLLGCVSTDAPGLTVLAASSLTEAFTELEAAFERHHPQVDVSLSFAGSQSLAMQVRQGLQADVLACADGAPLDALYQEGLAGPRRAFATNRLVLVVAEDQGVQDLEGLSEVGSLVVGGPEVPLGAYTEVLLDRGQQRYGDPWRDHVEGRVVSREPNARLVAAKVALGEADAAVVYATDARGLVGVRVIALPESPVAQYHHAALPSEEAERSSLWLHFVEGDEGQAILLDHGFSSP